MSDSLRPHESQHARLPCPSPTPGVYSNSCPTSRCCHPVIASSVVPFSCCPQSLSASGSFAMSQLFTWGGQSTGVSTLASFLPKKSPMCMPAQSCPTLCDPMNSSLTDSSEFSRQEYWSVLPFPTPRDLPNPGIEPRSLVPPALTGRFFTTVPPGKDFKMSPNWI